jgi:N-acetyl-anhydromuramyl-L-alanine amidase AmpD
MTYNIDYTHESPNYWDEFNDPSYILKVEAVCNHATARPDGSLSNSVDYLCSKAAGVSANYVIDLSGNIYCLVNPYATAAFPKGKRAWANGIPISPNRNIGWIDRCLNNGINLNSVTVSIEHVADSSWMFQGRPMPIEQQRASLWLNAKLLVDFGLQPTHDTVIGHRDIDSISRAHCPGVFDPRDWADKIATANTNSTASTTDGSAATPDSGNHEDPNAKYFIDTNLWVVNSLPDNTWIGFYNFWKNNGGVNSFGLPIGPAIFSDEFHRIVQWFEGGRLEAWPENADPYKVLRGLTGREEQALKVENKDLTEQVSELTKSEATEVASGLEAAEVTKAATHDPNLDSSPGSPAPGA